MLALSRQKRLWVCGWFAACTLVASSLSAQSAAPRISSEIANTKVSTLKGTLHPLAQPQFDAGRVPSDTRLTGISIVFNRSAAQQADLEALIAAQQNPASPLFHQWVTPEQFAARFGMAQADLDAVESWLQQQGFSIDSVARNNTMIRFSGNVNQVEQAFQTQMHYYNIGGVRHLAPSTDLAVPAALASVVLGVRNLNDFRPRSQVVVNRNAGVSPAFTSNQSGAVFFAPPDIVTAYDVQPVYSGGNTGLGQSIVVVGQSAINLKDIENFQSAAGLTVKDPRLVLMPNTGISEYYTGDETESDLDLEWSGAMAPGANISLVYVGSNQNYGAFDSILYAISQDLAPIISVSYGECEPEMSNSDVSTMEAAFLVAETQGQTIISASGDQGSTACFISPTSTSPSQTIQKEVAVNYPASSQYVTGMGGTEIASGNDAVGTYWDGTSGSDVLSTAKSYIPEIVWNDDSSTYGLSASGGGASTLFTKPSWQTGVTGIPADSKRDVPDIALYSSPNYPGYLYCTSDSSSWYSGQKASCNNGFRDSSTGDLTVAGGTSFAAPIFAGMLALINQQEGYTTGQGLINSKLYTIAANSPNYPSATGGPFHDVTSGNNDCTAGTKYCSSTTGFSAGIGYDQTTGLGSVDLYNLATAWTTSGSSLISTTTSISIPTPAPVVNVSGNYIVTVASIGSITIPTGTVSLSVDGGTAITGNNLTGGSYTYAHAFTSAGTHQIVAKYSGDGTHAASTGTLSVYVSSTSSGTGSISLSASPGTLTVTQGASGTETLTVTPSGGYTGTVDLSFTMSGGSSTSTICYDFPNILANGDGTVVIAANEGPVATQLTLDTNASDCSAVLPGAGGSHQMHSMHRSSTAGNNRVSSNKTDRTIPVPAGIAFAGLLLVGFLGRYSRKFRAMAGLVALLAVGLAVSACGGGGSAIVTTPSDSYTVTVTGTDSATSTITSTTTFTLTVNQ
jgi:subtilase family serine protease